jgi:hypothetical protein
MTDVNKMAEQFKNMMPQVNFNKNGYELRTQVLDMAQNHVWQDFHAKWAGYETSVVKDPKTGEIVTSVAMPEAPGADAVLETAQKFYEFVNNNKTK